MKRSRIVVLGALCAAIVFGASSGAATANFQTCNVDGGACVLNVTVNGGGKVTGPGIDCPPDCTEGYPYGTTVTITATPDPGYVFAGWGDFCGGTNPTCDVPMHADRAVTATFIPLRHLHVSVSGPGRITGPGIDCPSVCDADYPSGTTVELTATPDRSVFTGWGGDCAGTQPTCSLSLDGDRSASGAFRLPRLDVGVTGEGRVIGSGISCRPDCEESLVGGTVATLRAVPTLGYAFAGWGGDCGGAGTDRTCSVTVDADRRATATFMPRTTPVVAPAGIFGAVFARPTRTLSVNVSGNGTVVGVAGTAGAAAAARIACGSAGFACFARLDQGARVTLRARAARGFAFRRWRGACSGRQTTCSVTVSRARSAWATFKPLRRPTPLALGRGTARVTWIESVARGTIVARGRIAAPSRVRIELRLPGGKLLARHARTLSGRFAVLDRLPRGIRPGALVLAIDGRRVARQLRTIEVAAPREGVVDRAFATATEDGAPTRELPRRARQAWAHFHFLAQPVRGLSPVVTWYRPDGQVLGTVKLPNRPSVTSSIHAAGGIPSGTWRAELRVGDKVVKTLAARVRG